MKMWPEITLVTKILSFYVKLKLMRRVIVSDFGVEVEILLFLCMHSQRNGQKSKKMCAIPYNIPLLGNMLNGGVRILIRNSQIAIAVHLQ